VLEVHEKKGTATSCRSRPSNTHPQHASSTHKPEGKGALSLCVCGFEKLLVSTKTLKFSATKLFNCQKFSATKLFNCQTTLYVLSRCKTSLQFYQTQHSCSNSYSSLRLRNFQLAKARPMLPSKNALGTGTRTIEASS